ncbi:MAG TPA: polysaccharide biosynthesis tyrosine autokinase [Pyrinomonadaceae bacterium]|nr:polysaccharide biosynthesis tyrosine autokinase [Pyrinomonadaceae bacterium]
MKNNLKLIETRALEVREPVEPDFQQPAVDGYGYGYPEPNADDRAHLRKFLHSIRERLWVIAAITFLSTALVGVYMAYQPNLYEAKAQVQVDLETVNEAASDSKNGERVVNDPAYFNTQLQILTGDRLLRRVVKQLNLENDAAFRLPESATTRPLSAEDMDEATRLAPYVEAIRSNLMAAPVKENRLPIKETRLINISYSHPDRRLAARVVNAIADTFVLSNLERKTEANTATTDILQQRITELQGQIRTQENQLLEYAKNHQILSLDPTQNTVVERLTGLNRQLLEAQNELKLAEAAYRAAQQPGAAEAMAIDAAKDINVLEARLNELRQRLAQLRVENTDKWPENQEVMKQIAELEKQVRETRQQTTSSIKTNLETKYRQALAREQSLRQDFDRQRGETLTQNEAAINYRILQQEIETNKNLLDGMLQRSKENEAILAGLRNNIHVNDHAITPQAPVGPKRLLNTGIAFMLSLGFGVGLAVFLGYLDNSVHSADDVEKILPLPMLASIPAVGGRGRKLLPSVISQKSNGNGHHHELLLNGNAPAPLMEAYRQLRTHMLLSKGHAKMKSLLVTSSVPGEGKTTMAVNTAISLARTGALVLLIDADMRKPRLHKIFGLENEDGLSTILSDEVGDVEALKVIKHHEKSGVDVLTSGPVVAEATEYLGSDQMRKLVSTFRFTYDFIVIDSPPVAYFADGVLLSALVDGVVLVVNSGESVRDTVRQAYQVLQDVGANIYGVVLNNAKGVNYDYDYYYEKT